MSDKMNKSNVIKGWISLLALVLVGICFYQVNFSLVKLAEGIPQMIWFVKSAVPPDFSKLGSMLGSMLQTIQISIVGTIVAGFLSLLLCLGASSNFTPNKFVYTICRTLLNMFRSISEQIIALIFVTAVGLGAFSGALALAVHSAGMMGKFFAEAIENIEHGQVEAMRATGASKWQVIRYAVFPQVLPEFITTVLFRWEANIRSATVLGMVGAGGIGFDLVTSIRLFQYRETSAIVIITLITVIIIDQINNRLRAKII